METEGVRSPWEGPSPNYREVPPVNPKTGEPVTMYLCDSCGGAVLNRKLHTNAHRNKQVPGV